MANLFHSPTFALPDSIGDPISGAKLNFYEAGTTNRADTYTNNALSVAHANPVIADSAGRFDAIYLQAIEYKVVWTDADDVVLRTWDPVHGTLDTTGDDFAPSQQSPADMTVLVAAGSLYNQVTKALTVKTAQTSDVIVAPSANPRIDIIHIDRLSGVIGVDTGSEAASPVDPAITSNKLPIARVTLATTTTEIADSLITDIRELNTLGASHAVRYNTGADAGEIPLNDQAFDDVASATTTDIGAATSLNVNITGTTAITGFGTVAAGIRRNVKFAAALTLTHNGTSLILPGTVNITTAANDTAEFISLGGGNWLCLNYKNADGLPVVGSTLDTMVDATNAAADDLTEVDFTGIVSTTKRITILFDEISATGTNDYRILLGDAGGFETSGYVSTSVEVDGAPVVVSATAGFDFNAGAAANHSGAIVLTLMDSSTNLWVVSGNVARDTAAVHLLAGKKALSATLTQIRITTVGGTDTFDNGNLNIMVE